jgi:hypothetical protein
MLLAHRLPLLVAACASLVAAGCYCPMLSGRHGDVDCCAIRPPQGQVGGQVAPNAADSTHSHHDGRDRRGLAHSLHGLLHGGSDAAVPGYQGPDYISPHSKFHPLPTHPVFEPLVAYPLPEPIEPAVTPRHHGTAFADSR